MLNVSVTRGAYPAEATTFFQFDQLDAFHTPEVMRLMYDDTWYGVLISAGNEAFLHSFQPLSVPQGGSLDIDPFIGYTGPVLTADPSDAFREEAVEAYSAWCRAHGIIAEIMRFNPVLHNDEAFQSSPAIGVFKAKDIVVANCYPTEEAQLASFATKCRSSVKRGMRDCTFGPLDKTTEWDAFVEFYMASLQRIGADPRWAYTPEILARMGKSDLFQLYGVQHNGELSSASVVLAHPLASYYFLAASSEQPVQGANEYLLFGICKQVALQGGTHLILGGGNNAAEDDPLLRFKKKFAPEFSPLMLGRVAHEKQAFNQLVSATVAARPELEEVRFFLKYRL